MLEETHRNEFRVCHVCGYQKGFHIYLREAEQGRKIGLICPECGQSYDLGWVVSGLKDRLEKGGVFDA